VSEPTADYYAYADGIPIASPIDLEDWEPPPLTRERQDGLKARRYPEELPSVYTAVPDVPVTYDVESRSWRLLADYVWQGDDYALTARAGFSFDLSSIPRPLWWLIAPNELSILAPLFHDLLYSVRGVLPEPDVTPWRTFTRREADGVFLSLMEAEGVARWRRLAAYSAVRACGELAWRT
jgi:hypothetical protein